MEEKNIWTIGHSNKSIEEFIEILQSFNIQLIADIRSHPGSRHYPHFNKEMLRKSLPENGIYYIHLEGLGGRRKVKPDSVNTGWRLDSFRGYADYMETKDFRDAIEELKQIAEQANTAYMCAESLWWSCHRSLVSDYLKVERWNVIHIMGPSKSMNHHFRPPARIIKGRLSYSDSELFNRIL